MRLDQGSITSLFEYYESKSAEMKRMSVENGIISTGRSGEWNPEGETAEDWEKIRGGMTMKEVAVERKISYSQIRKRLKQFGYK
jgi:hypothetical protein